MRCVQVTTGMLLLGFFCVTIAGCGNKKITGPTWSTKFTMPMIMRTKNTLVPAKSGQIELGTGVNGLGEQGLNLTNSNSYTSDPEIWESDPLGAISMGINPISTLDLTTPLSAVAIGEQASLPDTDTTDFTFEDAGYKSATFSNTVNKNKIGLQLNGMVAQGSGLTVSFINNNAIIESVVIPAGQNTAVLSLGGKTLLPDKNLKIRISGELQKTANSVYIGFNWTTFEAVSFILASTAINSRIDYNFATEPIEFSFNLPSELSTAAMTAATLQLLPTMPANLVISGNLVIQSNNGQSTIPITITSGSTTNQDITNQLNSRLTSSPGTMTFRFESITLSGNAGQDVTITAADTIKINMGATLSFASITTEPQSMKVDSSIDSYAIETTNLVIEIKNYSPVALSIDLKLYPDNDTNPDNTPPAFDPVNDITMQIVLDPGNPGTRVSEKPITTSQLRNLIRNGTVYHQIAVTNHSSGAIVDADDYLEIRSRVEGRTQVNQQ